MVVVLYLFCAVCSGIFNVIEFYHIAVRITNADMIDLLNAEH